MAKAAITEQYLTDIADAIRSKTGMSSATYKPSQMAAAIMTISGSGGITPSGTISITENGTYNVTSYASAEVEVPTGSTINNQNKTVNPSTSQQTVTADSGYTGLGTVTVTAMPAQTLPTSAAATATSGYTLKATIGRSTSDQYINIGTGYNAAGAYYKVSAVANGTAGTPTATKGTVSDHSISVTPSVTNTTGYITGSTKTGTAVTVSASELVSGTLICDDSGDWNVINAETFRVQAGTAGTPTATKGSVSNHSVAITPSVTNTTGWIDGSTKTGTAITVSASELVSGNKAISSNGTNIDVTNYATVSVSVDSGGSTPTIDELNVTPSETAQTFNSSSVDGYKPVTVGAISSTYVGSGITQCDSTNLSVVGSTVTAAAGYYAEAASKSVTTMTLPTSAAASATTGYTSKATISRSTSDQYINIPIGYNSAGGYYKISAVANGSATGPSSLSASSATITTGTNTITLTKTSVTTTPTVSAGYVSSATASTATVALTASVTVNPTPTASGATVTIPAGYYSSQTTKSVTSGSATGPSSLSGTSATVSTGTNTLTLTKTGVSTTPTVSAGYVSSATSSTATVTLTASVTTKAAATITPGTTNQTIASGTYLTGTQTIAGDADLVASNIVSGVQIFGVTGNVVLQNYYTGSSAPSSSLGSNGDIYLQS